MLASSGTGAMEAAVTNTTSPGDRVLVVNGGKFGERWGKIARDLRPRRRRAQGRVGHAPSIPAAIATRARRSIPRRELVLMQGSETSTTVLHPVAEVAKITRERDTLLVVDGITAVGVLDLPMDALGIDVLLTGSQKALMLPPGLAFVALSERAWKARGGAEAAALLLRPEARARQPAEAHDRVDAGDLADLRLARGAPADVRGGSRQRLRAPRPSGARDARRRRRRSA